MYDQYKEKLFGAKQLRHGMNILRSEGHEIYGILVNKISLSAFDSKRQIADDGLHTNAYGYINMPALPEAEVREIDAELRELDIEALELLLGG